MTNAENNIFDSPIVQGASVEELQEICEELRRGEAHLDNVDMDNQEGQVVYTLHIAKFGANEVSRLIANEYWYDKVNKSIHTDSMLTPEEERLLDSTMEESLKGELAIPKNSNMLNVAETTSRFSSAIWFDKIKEQEVILAGLGGIGSYVAFLLSRLKVARMYIYDPDDVETVNLAGQLFAANHVGKHKTNAVSEIMSNFAQYYRVECFNKRYDHRSYKRPIMICGFDNMEARKVYFDNWLQELQIQKVTYKKHCLFIDGRLSADSYQVFAIQGNDSRAIKEYQDKWLFTDAEADSTICSFKQTTFMANMIASVMVNIFVNFVANQCEPLMPYEVPFFTQYDSTTMFTKIEA